MKKEISDLERIAYVGLSAQIVATGDDNFANFALGFLGGVQSVPEMAPVFVEMLRLSQRGFDDETGLYIRVGMGVLMDIFDEQQRNSITAIANTELPSGISGLMEAREQLIEEVKRVRVKVHLQGKQK